MELNYITFSPSRTEKDEITALYPYGRGERAPVALCREPVYVATTVGPGRAPPGRRTRAGRRDGGGFIITSPPVGETRGVGTAKLAPRRQERGLPPRLGRPALKSRRAKRRGIFLSCGANRPGARSAEGFSCPAVPTAPAHEVQRDFPVLRCQPPRSALCGGIFLPSAGTRRARVPVELQSLGGHATIVPSTRRYGERRDLSHESN